MLPTNFMWLMLVPSCTPADMRAYYIHFNLIFYFIVKLFLNSFHLLTYEPWKWLVLPFLQIWPSLWNLSKCAREKYFFTQWLTTSINLRIKFNSFCFSRMFYSSSWKRKVLRENGMPWTPEMVSLTSIPKTQELKHIT